MTAFDEAIAKERIAAGVQIALERDAALTGGAEHVVKQRKYAEKKLKEWGGTVKAEHIVRVYPTRNMNNTGWQVDFQVEGADWPNGCCSIMDDAAQPSGTQQAEPSFWRGIVLFFKNMLT